MMRINGIEPAPAATEALGGEFYVKSGNAWQQVSSITPDNTIEKEQP